MARSWHKAKGRLRCGGDEDYWIPDGVPYVLLSGPGWQKARCEKHSPYPMPETIDEPRPISFKAPSSFAPARDLAKVLPLGPRRIVRDAKQKQTGEDE